MTQFCHAGLQFTKILITNVGETGENLGILRKSDVVPTAVNWLQQSR